MPASRRDRWTGLVLMVVATFWCWGVVHTIPALGDASRLGARGFPLGLGVLLGLLGLAIFLLSFRAQPAVAGEAAADRVPRAIEAWAVTATVGLLAGYALLLEYAGFILATALVVALAIGPVLRVWRPRLILATSLGLAVGIYLVFGKLLGVYLPHGRWIDLSF